MMWQARDQQIGTFGPFRNPHTAVILRCSPALCGEPRRMETITSVCGPSRRRARARLLRMTRLLDGGHGARVWPRASLRPFCPTLRNAFDRARLQNAGDRQNAFSYAPDN